MFLKILAKGKQFYFNLILLMVMKMIAMCMGKIINKNQIHHKKRYKINKILK